MCSIYTQVEENDCLQEDDYKINTFGNVQYSSILYEFQYSMNTCQGYVASGNDRNGKWHTLYVYLESVVNIYPPI